MKRPALAPLEWGALAGFVAQQIIVVRTIPDSPLRHLAEPVYLATISATAIMVALIVLRLRAERDVRIEKLLLALFLAGMPVVYAWTALRTGAPVALEVAGIGVFGALAIAGWFVSPWFLAIGIAAHGVAWDVWHHGGLVVPSWYAFGYLVADLAFGAYVLEPPAT